MADSYVCPFSAIFATGKNCEFGNGTGLPWERLEDDMKHFSKVTMHSDKKNAKNVLIMGRKTWETFSKPLPGRLNWIITSKETSNDEKSNIRFYKTLPIALREAAIMISQGTVDKVFVIGGVNLIIEALKRRDLEYVYHTLVVSTKTIKADVFLENWGEQSQPHPYLSLVSRETISDKDHQIIISTWRTDYPHPERAYLDVVREVLRTGNQTQNRTGTISRKLWCTSFRVPLIPFPLFTSRRVFWRGIVEELLWFLRGSHNSKELEAKNINIWKDNSSRQYLDKLGLTHYPEGELGPIYGSQWRRWNGTAQDKINSLFSFVTKNCESRICLEMKRDFPDLNIEVDQIAELLKNISEVKKNPAHPSARRLILTAWNPSDLKIQALPPCHYNAQWGVDDGVLNVCINMRSNDLACGTPFNVASYALLTHLFAHFVGLIPGTLVLNAADAHIYESNMEGILLLINRPPRMWPKLSIVGSPSDIFSVSMDNICLTDYNPHPEIKMKMVA